MRIYSLTYNDFAHLDVLFPDAELVCIGSAHSVAKFFPCEEDIVIFHGGVDINPALYNDRPHPMTQKPNTPRDIIEVECMKKALEVGAFIYGICRGAQLACALNGGKLNQHITGHTGSNHSLDQLPFKSNSCHHQAMLPEGNFEVIATHGDIYEMLWYPETKCFCVQGHPEWLGFNDPMVQFCNNFIREHM
jgi:gamma-glutamyl-gamma-aminobutyrate hydrolase PuuD